MGSILNPASTRTVSAKSSTSTDAKITPSDRHKYPLQDLNFAHRKTTASPTIDGQKLSLQSKIEAAPIGAVIMALSTAALSAAMAAYHLINANPRVAIICGVSSVIWCMAAQSFKR